LRRRSGRRHREAPGRGGSQGSQGRLTCQGCRPVVRPTCPSRRGRCGPG
jgi:hypothetical protein